MSDADDRSWSPEPIPTEQLTRRDVPQARDWETIQKFALTLGGYSGTFDEDARLANARRPSSLHELRVCLHFEQRRFRHIDETPEGPNWEYILAIVDAIDALLAVRETGINATAHGI